MHSRSNIVHAWITCPDSRCRLAILHNNQPEQKIAAAMQSSNALHPVSALHFPNRISDREPLRTVHTGPKGKTHCDEQTDE